MYSMVTTVNNTVLFPIGKLLKMNLKSCHHKKTILTSGGDGC